MKKIGGNSSDVIFREVCDFGVPALVNLDIIAIFIIVNSSKQKVIPDDSDTFLKN